MRSSVFIGFVFTSIPSWYLQKRLLHTNFHEKVKVVMFPIWWAFYAGHDINNLQIFVFTILQKNLYYTNISERDKTILEDILFRKYLNDVYLLLCRIIKLFGNQFLNDNVVCYNLSPNGKATSYLMSLNFHRICKQLTRVFF